MMVIPAAMLAEQPLPAVLTTVMQTVPAGPEVATWEAAMLLPAAMPTAPTVPVLPVLSGPLPAPTTA